MPQVIEIILVGLLLHVRSPFSREFIAGAKYNGLRGRWDGVGKVWVFDPAYLDAVVALCRRVYAGADIRVPAVPVVAPRAAWVDVTPQGYGPGPEAAPVVAVTPPPPAPVAAPAGPSPEFLARVQEARARGAATRTETARVEQARQTPTRARDLILAGASQASEGAITSWHGAGSLSRADILDVLASASLPAEWAPPVKSAESQLGRVLAALNGDGRACRRAKTPRPDRYTARRDYRVRWIIQAGVDANVAIGEAAGRRLLGVELHDDDNVLHFDAGSDTALRLEIEQRYADLIAGEIYTAGDVTAWLVRVLRSQCGSARCGVNHYVPEGGRVTAEALVDVLSKRWGDSWQAPLLPVATGPALQSALARGFADKIAAVRRDLEGERATARSESRAEVSPAIAGRLIRDLAEVDADAAGYRVLVGVEALAPAIAALRALSAELGAIAGDSAQRFALLELDGDVRVETVPESVAVAERRLAPAAPVAAPIVAEAPKAPAADPTSASWERFSNLELD